MLVTTTSDLTYEQILDICSKSTWEADGGIGEPPIPTLHDLTRSNWELEGNDAAIATFQELHSKHEQKNDALSQSRIKRLALTDKSIDKATSEQILPVIENPTETEKTLEAQANAYQSLFIKFIMAFTKSSIADRIEAIHAIWAIAKETNPELKHPLGPIVRAWQQAHPPVAQWEKREKQIAPEFLKESRITTGERLPTGFLHTQGNESTQLQLPSFEDTADDIVVHALPIEIYEGGRGTRGAPLDERIFFNALLARPFGTPEPYNAVRLEPTLRDYVDWLYPNGWNRTNQLPLLQKALYDVHNKRISYERRSWNVVQVLAMPESSTHLDDPLPLIIRYPDGVQGNGPMINVHRMRQYGLVSASKWRAWIRLHYLWDTARQRNGGHPIYATIPKVKRNDQGYLLDARGDLILTGNPYKTHSGKWAVRQGNQPQTAWYHPYAFQIGNERNPQCDKIPVLTDRQLVALFFDDKLADNATFRKRKHDAIEDLMDFEKDGVVVVERDAIDTKRGVKGWRIISIFQDDKALPERSL